MSQLDEVGFYHFNYLNIKRQILVKKYRITAKGNGDTNRIKKGRETHTDFKITKNKNSHLSTSWIKPELHFGGVSRLKHWKCVL